MVTAAALHILREHADWLVTVKHAAYLLIVKVHQPTLHQLARLACRDIPIGDHTGGVVDPKVRRISVIGRPVVCTRSITSR